MGSAFHGEGQIVPWVCEGIRTWTTLCKALIPGAARENPSLWPGFGQPVGAPIQPQIALGAWVLTAWQSHAMGEAHPPRGGSEHHETLWNTEIVPPPHTPWSN